MRCIHPNDRPSVAARLSTARFDDLSHSTTFRFLRPDGRGEVWLEQVAITHVVSAGKPVCINGLTTDITERRRFEEEISRAWKSAALADRAKSSFLSAASHDLRQPLQALRFLQEALGLHLTDGEGRDLVGGMARSLDTMSGILSSLLDVNRLEAGNLRPSRSDFAISEIFESLAADFSIHYRQGVTVARGAFRDSWFSQRQANARNDDTQFAFERAAIHRSGKDFAGMPEGRRQGPDRSLGQRHRHHARSASSYIRGVLSGLARSGAWGLGIGPGDRQTFGTDAGPRDRCAFHSGQRHRDFD